jgi:hypothetical protein
VFEVVEVDIDTKAVTMMTDRPKDEKNAEAVMKMAIMRRSSDFNFFAVVPAGKYQDGDVYSADEETDQ